jgi:hypothetical protein
MKVCKCEGTIIAGVDSRIRYEVVDAFKEFIATFQAIGRQCIESLHGKQIS